MQAFALDPAKSMSQYAHRIWSQEEGLFQPTIYSLLQTHDGLIWLGTQDSLIRFDGIHFREFDEGQSVLHGSLIRSLAEDRYGNLWVGSLGSGLVRISPDGQVKQFSTQQGLKSSSVFKVIPMPDGSVWACTSDGLVRITKGRVQIITTAQGLPTNRIRTACVASDGSLWVAGLDFGLSHQVGSRFVSVPLPSAFRGSSIEALQCSSDGVIWIGTVSGLTSIPVQTANSYTTASGLPDDEVSALAEGPDGTLWIGTNDGITRLKNGELSVYRPRDGLSHSQVLALLVDREGDLWAGTKNGLDQFADGKVTPFTMNEGLLSNDVGPVLEDKSGHLCIGTRDKGLDFFDGRRFQALTTRQGLTSDSILSLAVNAAGDLWVGTTGGLNLVRDGKVAASYRAKDGLLGREVRSLFVDSEDTLWIGTDHGLEQWIAGRFRVVQPGSNASHNPVLAMSGDRGVRLFASLGDSSLDIFRDNRFSFHSLATTHAVDCFLLDPAQHTIWMGTLGSGLLRWKNGIISHLYVKDGLYDNRIYGILRDDKSNFWIASSKGIFRVSEKEIEDFADGKRQSVTSLPFSTGQLRFECQAGVQPAAWRAKDGRLWFSTTTGVVVVNPNHLQSNQAPPPVKIFSIVVDGERTQPVGVLHIKPRQANNLEIRYAGLSFVSPEKVTFRYRLEGYDRAWIDAGNRREAFYTNLPPGPFNFVVEARNSDGVWSSQPAALAFVVEPRLYQRRWFFPALALLIGLLVFAGLRLRIRRLKQRFSLVLAERNRIARELHDTLLQGLSGITMQMQALWTKLPHSPEKEFLGSIIGDAGRCSREARQSLWGLRSKESRESSFSQKLSVMARQSIAARHISLSEQIEPVDLSTFPDAEYQMLRIAREAITNTLKHAGALHLTIKLRQTGDVVSLAIEDDGFGFSGTDKARHGHFGMQGMRERAAEIGADLSIASSAAEGTRVSVYLSLSQKSSPEGNHRPVDAHQTK
ncbi:MAG TPA: two-component regulator propeller domain-containing protein [Bryobacteraceae bacterium]|nr:two-component regulator propeller domain-containing protein [Bryobacteraceae bacterium]